MTTETTRTDTHEFYVLQTGRSAEGWEVQYRPLNPKTGKPWQASQYVLDGCDIHPEGWWKPRFYSTVELARAARDRQIAKLAQRRRA